MKKLKKAATITQITLCLCAALGWWGIWYPQLTMTSDTYQVISEDGTIQETDDMIEWEFSDDIYRQILESDRSKIRFKSKILSALGDFFDQFFD